MKITTLKLQEKALKYFCAVLTLEDQSQSLVRT